MRRWATIPLVAAFFLPLLLFQGCQGKTQPQGPRFGEKPRAKNIEKTEYSFAICPLFNPDKMIQAYQPLIDYLNAHLSGTEVLVLDLSRDYAHFEAKYRAQTPAFILPNPWQTLQAMDQGYQVIAMSGDPVDFKGLFLIRKDSPITKPTDLKGKSISYCAPTSIAGCVLPQFFLHKAGIDVNKDIENHYVGSHESCIMNVYLKLTDIAATRPSAWDNFQKEHPKEAAELKVCWETGSFETNNSVMSSANIPPALTQQVQLLLIGLTENAEGRALLSSIETARFSSATNQDYEKIRSYISSFEKEVRPVEKQ
jgi:phosphonate transport system substrate-binding protein